MKKIDWVVPVTIDVFTFFHLEKEELSCAATPCHDVRFFVEPKYHYHNPQNTL